MFPAPGVLATANVGSLGMPGARAASISAVATATTSNRDLFDRRQDLAGAVDRLKVLPGIGEWTAQYIAMRALGEPDALPETDVGLLRAITALDGVRPSPTALLVRAEAWRPWRAYAAQHLWSSLSARSLVEREEAVA